MMMQPYKGYFINGSALMVHPFSPDWYVGGSVLVPGRSSSIVEIGLSASAVHREHQRTGGMVRAGVARLVVDECLAPPGTTAGR